MRQIRGFTLWELLAVLAAVTLFFLVLVPGLSCSDGDGEREEAGGRGGPAGTRPAGKRRPGGSWASGVRERARQAVCMANLLSIGRAMHEYCGEYNDQMPRLRRDGDAVEPISLATQTDDLDKDAAKLGAAAMQNLWLLIRGDYVSVKKFRCPSDDGWLARPAFALGYGWTSNRHFSYGLHYPYDRNGEKKNPAAWIDTLDGGMAIMADQNPATLEGLSHGMGVSASAPHVDPSNHPAEGQSVMYASASVRFHTGREGRKDSRAGYGGDEIYEPQSGDMPATHTDSYIVPTVEK